ncbi:thioesterase II family protein [Streptomyces sp. ST2-7A]|uniref:thioesterase II family protein n=1 Tax=Streptomyces sp. ST2-7A TaxID=2907214 RepID=UPI001F25482D|nr:alpha/beta fold hydrolase [Streptomyces sp. ST2-7A]MCE7080615.1 alpha/beta fold hydrolase [Streptomyces sp. ST2-7A]
MRLFCFPHAGGGATAFHAWRAALRPDVEVAAVVLPGREGRVRETPYRRMAELIPPLAEAVAGHVDGPYAIFGHSTGAAVGYEVARRLSAGPTDPPRCLFVSGRWAPAGRRAGHREVPAFRKEMTDQEILDLVVRLGGVPAGLRQQPGLLRLFLPVLRADFELNEGYARRPGEPLDCPVVAMSGADDPVVTPREMNEWRRITTGPFRLRIFQGGHFYHTAALSEVARTIRAELDRPTAPAGYP